MAEIVTSKPVRLSVLAETLGTPVASRGADPESSEPKTVAAAVAEAVLAAAIDEHEIPAPPPPPPRSYARHLAAANAVAATVGLLHHFL